MKLITFPEQNSIYAENQPEYIPLPAYKAPDGRLTCCWKLNLSERLQILLTGKIWHQVLTFNQPLQPQLLLTKKPI